MNVETLIQQADSLVGQEVDLEDFIIIVEQAKQQIAYLSSSEEIHEIDQKQVLIDHSLAELKTIIRPLPSMQLLFRGVMIYPPYFYRFRARLRATVDMDAHNVPVLRNIRTIELDIPYTGKTGEWSLHNTFYYSAELDYSPVSIDNKKQMARATVHTRKKLLLAENEVQGEVIPEEENRYARRVSNQTIILSGWLETVKSKNDIMNHMLFLTRALRYSVVAVGPLREDTAIWIRPSNLYQLLKTHMPANPERSLHQAVEICGQVDYLPDDEIPQIEKSPKLVFSELYWISINETNYLL